MTKRTFFVRGWLPVACCLSIAGVAAAQYRSAGVRVDHTYPPVEDLRRPDITLTEVETGPVSVLAYTPEGRATFTAGADKKIRMWDARTGEQLTGELLRTMEGHTGAILAVTNSADRKSLLSLSDDRTVKTWDPATGKLLGSTDVKLSGTSVARLAFRPGDEPAIAEIVGNQIKLWRVDGGKLLGTFNFQPLKNSPDAKLTCMAFSPDGTLLATGSDKGTICIWDSEASKVLRSAEIDSPINSIAVSPTHVGAGCEDGGVALWKIEGNQPPQTFTYHTRAVKVVAFSARGDQFASGSGSVVNVLDTATGKMLCAQEGHRAPIVSVAFNPNGQKMASGDMQGNVNYWTVPLPPIPPENLQKISAAVPAKATATPKKPRKLLVFWRADAILHKGGVPAANKAIELMGKKTGAYTADFSREYEVLDPKVLSNYDAIVLNSTAHLKMPNEETKQALIDYAKGGGGVVGIHAAIDTFKGWPEGAEIVGATFGGHPWTPGGTWAMKLDEPDHPLVRAWGGKNFKMHDEVYELAAPYRRSDRRVLISMDMSDPTTAGVKPLFRKDNDFAVSWIKRHGQGRVFFCMFGHIGEPFENPMVLQYYLDGIQYALGDLAVDDTPLPEATIKTP